MSILPQRAAWRGAMLFLAAAITHPRPVHSQRDVDENAFVRWATAHAVPVRSVEMAGSLDDLQPLSSIVGSARVVALGEPTHAPRTLRANGGTFVKLAPARAFDVLWYAGSLTPARSNAP